MESDFDPEVGFTVSFTHLEQSGYYECKVVDNEDHNIQFHVRVDANCESKCDDKNGNNVVNSSIDELHFGDGISLPNINNSIHHYLVYKLSKVSKRMISESLEVKMMKVLDEFIINGSINSKSKRCRVCDVCVK